MGISVQNNTCCYGMFTPYVEGKNCFERSFGDIPAEMVNDSSAKKLAYRVKEFVKGVALWIPLVNIIVYLALRCFANQQRPVSPPPPPRNPNSSGGPGPNCRPPVRVDERPLGDIARAALPVCPLPMVHAQCPPATPSPSCTEVPTKVDNSSSLICAEDYGFVPEVGLPNFVYSERPYLDNICWMNSACQTILRSPVLVKRILKVEKLERERKLQGNEKPSEIIRLLKEMIVTIRKCDLAVIPKIQKKMILFYKSDIKKSFEFGTQDDPSELILRIMTDLKLGYSVLVKYGDRAPKDCTLPTITLGFRPGESYLQAIEKRHDWTAFRAKSTTTHFVTKIPPVIMIQIMGTRRNITFNEIPHRADFSSIFSPAIQAERKQLFYNLISSPNHSNPMNPDFGGHLTCQQEKESKLYDDMRVRAIKDPVTVDRNFIDSDFQVWEIEDHSLVDKSYALSESVKVPCPPVSAIPSCPAPVKVDERPSGDSVRAALPVCAPVTASAPCSLVSAIPSCPAPVPTKVGDCSSSRCGDDYVPVRGLPNFSERPILNNVCWMNAACQTIFRSSVLVNRILLVERIERERKQGGVEKPSVVIRLLKELMDILRSDDKASIPRIQKQMIEFYKSDIDKTFQIGSQNDPALLIPRVITDLKLQYSMVTEFEINPPKDPDGEAYVQRQLISRPNKDFTCSEINLSYSPGQSYLQAVANRQLTRISFGPNRFVNMNQRVTKIPTVLVFKIVSMRGITFNEIPHEADFRSIFSKSIQAQYKDKPLLYKLVSGPQHSNPRAGGLSGHYMCQQEKDGNHYDDMRVRSIKDPTQVDQNFIDSRFHVWEIVDPTLVDKSYVLNES